MWFRGWTYRQRRLAWAATLIVSAVTLLILLPHHLRRNHYLDAEGLQQIRTLVTKTPPELQDDEIDSVCRAHGFVPYGKPRKVYDLFLFNTEFDWLEIRLHTLSPLVDYFVIVESPYTFSTRPKNLWLHENFDRVSDFHHQIILRSVESPVQSAWLWDNEDYIRNAMLTDVFPSLLNTTQAAEPGDVIAVSDIDEIIRPEAMFLLRHCAFPPRLTLRSLFFKNSFQWLRRGKQWERPQATTFQSSVGTTIRPNDLRMDLVGPGFSPFAKARHWWDRATLWNAGWHCSSCFATLNEVLGKMDSFSHQIWNTKANRDPRAIVDKVRNGTDLFNRVDEQADWVGENVDVPEYIMQEYKLNGRFKYLVDRGSEGAGFEDWEEMTRAQ